MIFAQVIHTWGDQQRSGLVVLILVVVLIIVLAGKKR